MKLSLLNYKTRSQLKRNKAMRSNLPYAQAINVGIVFTVESKEKHDEVKHFVKRLEQDGKKVTVVSFLPRNKENYEFLYDFFTEKEVSFWGNVESAAVSRFVESNFDFLYCLDSDPHPMVMHLVARSKAKCRIGRFWEGREGFFEMMVDARTGLKSMIDEMYRYSHALH